MMMNLSGKLTFDWKQSTQTQLTCYYDRGEKRYSSTNDPDCRLDVVSNDSGIADDATWYYTPASPTFQEKIWKVQALQDTTINNQVYKLIGIDKGQGIIHESKIPIAIVNKKMMFFEQGASHLIFDFAAQIGDTVTYKVPSLAYYYDITFNKGFTRPILPSFQMIVSSIDTVKTMEGKMIKRFATRSIIGTNGFGHAIFNLAENVGSIAHGFFGSFGPYITQDKQGYFRCFQSSDLNFNVLNKDCLLSNIADVNENRIKIYPNPSMDILNIESDFDILDVNIRTVEGTSVYYNKSCPSTIDISHFKSGIYFIEIRDMAHHLISISKLIKL
jgi:hypothetical protein